MAEYKKIITRRKAPLSRSMGPHVRQVIPSAAENIDPFVFLDHFGPMEKSPGSGGVPPHPHAGIATITYLFAGSNRHQDSYGHDAVIEVGDLAWMQAGKGIVHSEGMNEGLSEAQVIHGLQLWISLPAKDKFIEPDFFFYPSKDLPITEFSGASIKILCGELNGHKAPTTSLSPAYLFDANIPLGVTLNLPITQEYTCGVYLITGEIEIDDQVLSPETMVKLDEEGSILSIKATAVSRVIILGGKPLNEPIIAYASYVMNSKQQILQVMDDYKQGKMGRIQL